MTTVENGTHVGIDPAPKKDLVATSGFSAWIDPQNQPVIEYLLNTRHTDDAMLLKNMQDTYENPGSSWTDDAKTNSYSGRDIPFTRGERKILYYIAASFSNKEIASQLEVSDQTVKNHLTSIIRKSKQKDRYGVVLLAIESGVVEPLLIDVQTDFGGYCEMGVREKQVYEMINQPGSASNREIADELFVTEQTIKNHMTRVLAKVGVADRGQAILYEAKRREKILLGDKESDDLSDQQKLILDILAVEPSLPRTAVTRQSTGIFRTSDNLKDIYKKLGVGNLIECTAVALLHGYSAEGHFVTHRERTAIEHLDPDNASLLLKFGSFPDATSFIERADRIGIRPNELKEKLNNLLSLPGIPSIYQSIVVLQLSKLEKDRADLRQRQERVDEIRAGLNTHDEPREERHDFYL